MEQKLHQFKEKMRAIADINYSAAVLQWDQEVNMPPKGAQARSRQLATLAGMSHEMSVSPELSDLINELLADDSILGKDRANLLEARRNIDDKLKYPTEFVVQMSKEVSEAFNSWQTARKKSDFSLFSPNLERLVDMKLKECELLGYSGHPYDALIDQYEHGATKKKLDVLFNDVKDQLLPFIKQVLDQEPPADDFLYKHYDKDVQWEYGLRLLKQMGYDFNAGRQDLSTHPFTTNFSAKDVRVTTRINENDLSEMIWSCIHEGGHALYEQGLPDEDYGLPSGEYLSLGIHESQSRLWENNVGRSFDYWELNYSYLQSLFPESLSKVNLDDFYRAINKVKPSLIRTSADELTYHLHVMIRYELEVALMEKQIKVSELPGVWNEKYKEYLGVDVPSDSKGVLQDIHWSHGSFGYFPTYSIGSFYAAQFFAKLSEEIPDIRSQIRSGNFASLLKWLNTRIHECGRTMTSEELCEKVTGEPLNLQHFINYAENKFSVIYPDLAAEKM
jgi:carboxypeptidase Taq